MQRMTAIVAGLWIALFAASDLWAASGSTFTLTGHDLQVDVDSRWAGCGAGGYCPVRFKVINRGPTRTLTFRVAKSHDPLANVKLTQEIKQNEMVHLSLPVPLVSYTNYGDFRVEDRSGLLDRMSSGVQFPEVNQVDLGRAGCVVVSPDVIVMQPFENGLATYRHLNGMAATSGHGRGHVSSASDNTVIVPEISLPASWVEYSGVDLVIIPAESLTRVRKDVRTALTQWTRCGGTLLVTNLVAASTDRDTLLKSLLGTTAPATIVWNEAKTADRDAIPMTVEIDTGGAIRTSSPPPKGSPQQWSLEMPPFAITEIGLGKLIVFRNDPLPGTIQDWTWLLKSAGGVTQWEFGRRIGQSSRSGTDDFMLFLIPGISGVPVVMFLVLITIFSVVIGPVNYFILARRKQLHLLLLTIPGLAIVTSLLLFGYSAVAHGFSVKARSRSLTFIDQPAQAAVTMSRLSLYAGQAPSGGLRFSRDTAVLPIWPEHSTFESGNVDWTESQVLTSGWLRSRTRTQFLTINHRAERGRLEVKPQASDKLSVTNGFEWGFAKLAVVDESGKLFIGDNVPAGARIELTPASPDEWNALSEALRRHALELPPGLSGGGPSSIFMSGPGRHPRYGYGYGSVGTLWHFQQSRMETIWQRMALHKCVSLEAEPKSTDPVPRTYFGLTAQNPGTEIGVAKATEIASSHVVIGKW